MNSDGGIAMIVKCLSVKLPWAAWIADGTKVIEFRTWVTGYRGPLLIVASRKSEKGYKDHELEGKSICVAELGAIDRTSLLDRKEPGFPGDYVIRGKKYYSWIIGDSFLVNHIPIKGQLGIYERDITDESIIAAYKKLTEEGK
jgi:hypothetical protein